jgi:DNA-binding transcriptional MerR regulator
MDITQLSRVTSVPVNTLRHYQQLGLFATADQGSTDTKRYADAHVHTVKLIKLATGVGYKLREILAVLDAKHRGDEVRLREAMDIVILRKAQIENNELTALKQKQLDTLKAELDGIVASP